MNAGYEVIYSQKALDDLRRIFAYIAFELQVPNTAVKQVNRIRDKARSLNFMPERYESIDWEPWKSRNIHRVPIDNFIIFFAVDRDEMIVRIGRIFYGGQDIDGILRGERMK